MKKVTPQEIARKREEIINACEELYKVKSFREITLKDIGGMTSFSRPTIYNYFVTKEEIFLSLFKREYDLWNEQLSSIIENNERLSGEQLADLLSKSIAERPQLLKLLSMNNYDMEANSRQEFLTEFKHSFGRSIALMRETLEKFCPKMGEKGIDGFLHTFFPFMFGIHPFTSVTEKQKVAMKEAGMEYRYLTAYELTHSCISRLLGIGNGGEA